MTKRRAETSNGVPSTERSSLQATPPEPVGCHLSALASPMNTPSKSGCAATLDTTARRQTAVSVRTEIPV